MTWPRTPRRYWAFISYSWRDKPYAATLHRRLERFTIPSSMRKVVAQQWVLPANRLRPVFRDDEEMAISGALGQRLRDAIDGSAAMVLLASPDSAASRYVNEEVAHFLSTRGVDRLIVIAIGGTTHEPPIWPPALRDVGPGLLWVDCRGHRQPDRRELVRVVAAILDVNVDTLWGRHRRRQRRIAAAVGAAALALVATFGYLVIDQQASQRQSVASEQRAQENQRLAESSQKLSPEAQRTAFEKYLTAQKLDLLKQLDPDAVEADLAYKVVRADDVSHDGLLDYVVIDETPMSCGSGGCAYNVYLTEEPGKYVDALALLGADNPQIRERDGEVDVVASGPFVNGQPLYVVYQLAGKKYELAEYLFCDGVALDFCNEPISFTAVDADDYTVSTGAVALARPETSAPPAELNATMDPSTFEPRVLGVSTDGQWYAVSMWKGYAGFVPARAVSG